MRRPEGKPKLTLTRDAFYRGDLAKLLSVGMVLLGIILVFFVTPGLSTATAIAIVGALLLSPLVSRLERRGLSRSQAITSLFAGVGLGLISIGTWGVNTGAREWSGFREKAPVYFQQTVERLQEFEAHTKASYPILSPVKATETLVGWGKRTGDWFLTHGPALAGELLTTMILGPILIFFLLSEGPNLRRAFFRLVPNRHFETLFDVTHEVTGSLADYLRAKLIEALLVGILTTVGLLAIGAPYSIVLGIISGVTNILPYIGPLIGAAPALAIPLLDPSHADLLIPLSLVFLIVNLIDTFVIFPLIVAKLVNLHPLILISSVMVGQEYYGLVGMLISIPFSSVLKIISLQIYRGIYEKRAATTSL